MVEIVLCLFHLNHSSEESVPLNLHDLKESCLMSQRIGLPSEFAEKEYVFGQDTEHSAKAHKTVFKYLNTYAVLKERSESYIVIV